MSSKLKCVPRRTTKRQLIINTLQTRPRCVESSAVAPAKPLGKGSSKIKESSIPCKKHKLSLAKLKTSQPLVDLGFGASACGESRENIRFRLNKL